ncbi:hypothetical protein BDY24DRAFT_414598 [Mrakia frigida]|uniref:uncharacterized protein n=1 Tax=Mrakia frigida TaxID=29902 RepID=UPI003FCC14A5
MSSSSWVESLANKPASALLVPIASIPSLLSSSSSASLVTKIRIAGRLLAYDSSSGFMLLSSHDGSTGIWVDPSLAFDGSRPEETPLGILQRTEGGRSPWMITGELIRLEEELPRTPSTLSRPVRKRLGVILPFLLSAILVVHVPTLEMSVWEEAAKERMESGLKGREQRREKLGLEGKREDERLGVR